MVFPLRPLQMCRQLRRSAQVPDGHVRGPGRLQADSRTEQPDPALRHLGGQVLVGEGAQGFGGSVCHAFDDAPPH